MSRPCGNADCFEIIESDYDHCDECTEALGVANAEPEPTPDPFLALVGRVEDRRDEFLVDSGDYGYGGEWFPSRDISAPAIALFALELAQEQAEQAAAAPPAPEPTPEPPAPAKARRSPRKASVPAEFDYKALYEIASQNIRAMCLAGGFIPGVAPNCPCPHCPKPIECANEQIGPTSTVERRGEAMFDS